MNWVLLQNSLLVAGSATVAAVAGGGLAAIGLSCLERRWRQPLLVAAIIALALPPFLVTNCWLDLLGQAGRWHSWLPANIYSRPGTVWVLSLMLWPISLLLVQGDLGKLEPSYLESDPALRGWPLIRWLLFPIVRPALGQAAVVTFVLAANNFAVPAILQTKVFPAELWVNFNTTFDYAAALKLGWPLLVVPLLVWGWFRGKSIAWPRQSGTPAPALLRRRLGRGWLSFCLLVCILLVGLAVVVPLMDLALARRTWQELPGAWAAGHSSILNSFWLSAAGATLALGTGLLLWRQSWGILFGFWFFVPGVMLGMALIFLFNRDGLILFYQSPAIVVAGLSIRYAVVGWSGAAEALRATDSRLRDFARLNGGTRWQQFFYVSWPQIASAMGALWFVIYLLCLWDVETQVLIVPPGGETLALRIFNLLHYGHNAQVNALCVVLLGLAVLPLALYSGYTQVAGALRHRAWLPATPTLALLFLPLLWCGCNPARSTEAPLQSRLFERAEIIGSRGTALGKFNKPRSLTVDAQDNLYVVDMTGRVQKFSSNGVYLTSWQMPQIEKGKPKGMCRDSAGNIVVVEPHYNRVNHFSTSGKLLAQWGSPGTNSGQLCLPRAAAINSLGHILVCEYTQVDRVQEFSAFGKQWIRTLGRSGLAPGEFNRPEGVAVDKEDNIYVADSCNHRVQVFSAAGKFLRCYGRAGSGLGELSYPYDIQVDAAGLQYVCEFGNSRVQVFDRTGQPVEIIGGTGAAPGQFNNPWSLALDSAGNLYVADSQNHRVQKLIRKAPLVRSLPAAPSLASLPGPAKPAALVNLSSASR